MALSWQAMGYGKGGARGPAKSSPTFTPVKSAPEPKPPPPTKAEKAVAAAALQQEKQQAKQEQQQAKVETKILKNELTVKKVGAVLSVDEYNNLKSALGSDARIAGFAAGRGIKLDPEITNPTPKDPPPPAKPPANIPGYTAPAGGGEVNPAVFDRQTAIDKINAQGNIYTRIQEIETEGNRYISELQTNASRYASDRELEAENTRAAAARYMSDRQLEGNLGVENIRTKGSIDLQGIINAGTSNIENIRGEYELKSKKLDRNTAILNSLAYAFSF